MKKTTFLIAILFSFFSCKKTLQSSHFKEEKKENASATLPFKPIEINGLSFVAPPDPFPQNPMTEVQNIGAQWIAVIPYAYTMPKDTRVRYNEGKNWQWYGEKPEGVKETIRLAQEAGVKVMLKPQVYCPNSWTGALDFDTDEKWETWESSYEKYIMTFVEIAKNQNVEMFCIGTEFKLSVTKREKFWRKLIEKIRTVYQGKLTYAANWDEYPTVPFWDALDFAGVNAYFPLTDEKTPSLESLNKAWKQPLAALQSFYDKTKKPIVFTEYGYLSVDGCAYMGWELEKKIEELPINQQAQANAIEALLSNFSTQTWWKGGFIWKWFPNMKGHEGYPDKDYTPQGKLAADILKKYYSAK
jgi:hypothetical protein